MKRKQFESLCREILPGLPSFACKGWLLYEQPASHILRGFCCDDSNFDPDIFTVTSFVLPLYVPTRHVYLDIGARLKDERGCDVWWNIHAPHLADDLLLAIRRDGLPLLSEASRPSDLVSVVQGRPGNTNPRSLEAIAYSLVMAGDFVSAKCALDHLVDNLDTNTPWQAEMLVRAKQLAHKLTVDRQAAREQLADWEQETLRHISL